LERVGERIIKTTFYIPLIPTFSLKGEGAGTSVDTCAFGEYSRIPLTPYDKLMTGFRKALLSGSRRTQGDRDFGILNCVF